MMKTKDNDYVYYQLLAIGFYDECLFYCLIVLMI